MKKELTPKQTAFLEALFGDAKGDFSAAARLAGYSMKDIQSIIAPIKDEIIDRAEMMLVMNAPKAVLGMVGVLDEPTALGNKDKMNAAKDILDRAGLARAERIDQKAVKQIGIFILPAKSDDAGE